MTFKDFVNQIIAIANHVVIPIIFALAFVVFLWGIANYFVFSGADATKRNSARAFMLWGIIGMVLLFSVWGIVKLLISAIGL